MSNPKSQHHSREGQHQKDEPSSGNSHIDFNGLKNGLGDSFPNKIEDSAPSPPLNDRVNDRVSDRDGLPPSAAKPHLADHELLLQASQIAEHLRNQYTELDRREQVLNEQLARLDQEQRQQRFREQEVENEIQCRDRELKQREIEFGSRVEACQTLVDDLEAQEKTFLESKKELDLQKRNLREDLQQELIDEKRTLQHLQTEYEQKNEGLQTQIEKNENESIDALRKIDQQLEDERKKLRKDLLGELEIEQSTVQKEKIEWEQQYAIQKQALEEATTDFDRKCQADEQYLQAKKEQQESELEKHRTESLKDFKVQRIEWEAKKERESQDLSAELQMVETAVGKAEEQIELRRQELEKEYHQKLGSVEQTLNQERASNIEELSERQKNLQAAFEKEKAEFRKTADIEKVALKNQREEVEKSKSLQLAEWERQFDEQMTKLKTEKDLLEREISLEKEKIHKEKTVIENRIKFQQDHLQKSQKEYEADHHEFELTVQTKQTEFQQQELLLHYRSTQLDHYRALSDERFGSLEREHRLLASARKTLEGDSLKEREHFQLQQNAWEKERAVQQAELQRQQDMLDQHAETLERRKERLDQLRNELEETHRETLEMRMSVEEAMAQLTQSTNEEEAKNRVEEAKSSLSELYKNLRGSVIQQRVALQETQNLQLSQRDELEEEKQKFTEWFAEQEDLLKQWKSRLLINTGELDEKISSYREMRDTVFSERVEAESIIRELLDQLGQVNQPATDDEKAENPSDEMTDTETERTIHSPHASGPHFSSTSKRKSSSNDKDASSASS